MGSSVVGALRVVLGIDTAQFESGLSAAQKDLAEAGRRFQKIGAQLQDVGKTLTIGLTAPLVALGVASIKVAGDFEASMKRVGIAAGATGGELLALEKLARQIGKTTVFSASEAAHAMEELAKTGVSTKDILNGAATATVNLAAATDSELAPAAKAVADSMNQFKLSAKDLPAVVNTITGAVNASKLDFQDYQLAIGQAGGVAGSLGVSFTDFNTVLAATSSLFGSGSDAGTSFKTFLTALVPKSKSAGEAMKKYGLQFFNANGSMKSMSDIAQVLQDKLGGLNDETKNQVLTDVFGTDAMRTAVGLMDKGAKGLNDVAASIAKVNAAAQANEKMKGFNGQLESLKGSFQDLAIAIGKTGFLEFMTRLVKGIADLTDKLSAVNPQLLAIGVGFAAFLAALGPVIVAVGAVVSAIGTIGAAFGAGGLLAFLGPALPIIAAVAAAVAVLAIGFVAFKDQVIPALQAAWNAISEALGPPLKDLFGAVKDLLTAFSAVWSAFWESEFGQYLAQALSDLWQLGLAFGKAFGGAILTLIKGVIIVITDVLKVITDLVQAVAALSRGDWPQAWDRMKQAVYDAAHAIGTVVVTVLQTIVDLVAGVFTAVKDYMVNRLGAVWEKVGQDIERVKGFFYGLWDAVVGHSYVPDMVEGIAAWMAKLDAGMVKPAKSATAKTKAAFEKLRDDLAPILEGLLTDQEKANRDYAKAMALLDRDRTLSPSAKLDAKIKLADQYRTEPVDLRKATPVKVDSSPDEFKAAGHSLKVANDNIVEGINRTRDAWGDAFADGVEGVLYGDLKDVLKSWVANWARSGLEEAGKALFDMFKSSGGLKGIGQAIASIFGGGDKLPGFKNGGSFTVGGAGGIDNNLVAFRATRGERVDIRTPGQDMGGVGARVIRVVVDKSKLFDVAVNEAAQPMVAAYSGAAAQGGAEMAETNLSARRRKTLGAGRR